MNKRDIFLPSVTSLIIFGLVWFLSCSHGISRRHLSQEELSEERFEALAESAAQEPALAEEPELAMGSTESKAVAQKPERSERAETAETAEKVEKQEELEKPEMAMAPPKAEAPSQMSRWKSELPEISESPLSIGNANLNRFYFVRKGDTPRSFSEFAFQSEKFAGALAKWNPGKWSPGRVIYYQSAEAPTDSRMKSFYQEKGLNTSEYRIQNGESLSRVAKRELGHYQSWKELAVINGIKDVDQVKVGTLLAIYSFEVKEGPVAKAVQPAPQAPVAKAPVIPAPVAKAPVIQAPVAKVEAPAVPVAPKAPMPPSVPQNQPRAISSPKTQSWTERMFSFLENVWEETQEFIESAAQKFSAKSNSKTRKP